MREEEKVGEIEDIENRIRGGKRGRKDGRKEVEENKVVEIHSKKMENRDGK